MVGDELEIVVAEVGAVGRGAFLDEVAKALGREDGGVVGEQAEQQAHQQHFERVAGVAALAQRVVQAAHALGGPDVDRILRLDFLRLVAGDEAEPAHMLVQVLERERDVAARVEVDHAETREIAHHQGVGQIALGDAGKVAQGLLVGGLQRLAARFLLHQHLAGPEQIDIALAATVLLDGVLETGDAAVGKAEDLEEVDPERDGLLLFVGRVFPAARERHGAGLDFVPGQGHGSEGAAGSPESELSASGATVADLSASYHLDDASQG